MGRECNGRLDDFAPDHAYGGDLNDVRGGESRRFQVENDQIIKRLNIKTDFLDFPFFHENILLPAPFYRLINMSSRRRYW